MVLRFLLNVATLLLVGVISPTFSSSAETIQPGYVILRGTPAQKAEVTKALDASSFDWDVVPAVVKIRIAPGPKNWSRRGEIRLSAELLDKGRASWGTVQHEYAHQVDLHLLDDSERAKLLPALGAQVWFSKDDKVTHGDRGAERFASTLAWTYWQSRHNTMRPRFSDDESAAMKPARLRAMLSDVLP